MRKGRDARITAHIMMVLTPLHHVIAAMTDQELLTRITTNPKVMVGKPVIKGTRLTVEYILNLLAHGASVEEILEEYEGLVEADIQSCLLFASRSLESTRFMPLTDRYPLRSKQPYQFDDPFSSAVPPEDWDALK
jgi:uncharacterized protein (DUF433 family)